MHPLVNASFGAIGNRANVNADWPGVQWLAAHWQQVFGMPVPAEQTLGDPSGLQWAAYVFAVYSLACTYVGPGRNWADPNNLRAARSAILAFAQSNPPPISAPVGQCGPGMGHPLAAASFALAPAPRLNSRAPAARMRVGFSQRNSKSSSRRRPSKAEKKRRR